MKRHHKAKMPFDKVQQIRRMYASGQVGYKILSRAMKCGESTIRDIVQYRTRAAS